MLGCSWSPEVERADTDLEVESVYSSRSVVDKKENGWEADERNESRSEGKRK